MVHSYARRLSISTYLIMGLSLRIHSILYSLSNIGEKEGPIGLDVIFLLAQGQPRVVW